MELPQGLKWINSGLGVLEQLKMQQMRYVLLCIVGVSFMCVHMKGILTILFVWVIYCLALSNLNHSKYNRYWTQMRYFVYNMLLSMETTHIDKNIIDSDIKDRSELLRECIS